MIKKNALTDRLTTLFIFLIALFAAMAMPLGAAAAPKIDVNVDYYEVGGNTEKKIRRDINKKRGSVRGDGKKYDALTKWNVEWRFWSRQSGSLCAITKVEIELDIQYVLPKLRRDRGLPSSTKLKWKKYMKALIRHEKGHGSIAVRAAAAIDNKIGSMSPRRTCAQLKKDANDIGHTIVRKANARDIKYDVDTNHGVDTGAKFP